VSLKEIYVHQYLTCIIFRASIDSQIAPEAMRPRHRLHSHQDVPLTQQSVLLSGNKMNCKYIHAPAQLRYRFYC
jgi:hypothetical protein